MSQLALEESSHWIGARRGQAELCASSPGFPPPDDRESSRQRALAEARSHFHKTQFPSGCPLDNDVCARQGAVPAAAACNKDASGDVAMGEVDGLWSSNCPRPLTKRPQTSGNSTENLKRRCNKFEMKREPKQPNVEKSTWQALRQPRRLEGRRAFDQSADDEEIPRFEQELDCIS